MGLGEDEIAKLEGVSHQMVSLYVGKSYIKFSGCVFRYDSSKCKIVVCDKNM